MRRKVRGVLAGVVAALCSVALAGCGLLSTGDVDGPFVGDWKLVEARWGAGLDLPRTGITLVSDGDSASGFAGCHEYAFELSGKPEAFKVGKPLEHGPSGPATGDFGTCNSALDRIEARYLTALLSADSAQVRDGALVLTAGYSYLRFEAIPPFPGPRLAGTDWVLEAYGETWLDRWASDVIGVPTLRFVGSDRIVGTLSCGGILGTYRVVRTEVFVMSLHRFGDEKCLSSFSEQDQLLAQFLDGFRVTLAGDDHLVLTHERLQLQYRAAPSA
jgi:hypothetical protein